MPRTGHYVIFIIKYYMNELKEEILSANSFIGNRKLNSKIKSATLHIDCKSIKERVYCILNDINEISKCTCCDEKVNFDKIKNVYSAFCSKTCYNKWRKEDKKQRNYILNNTLLQDKENYIECKVCGSAVKAIAAHLKLSKDGKHSGWDLSRYKTEFPTEPIISTNTSKTLSEQSKGANNGMHSSKTTKEFRKSISPFSIEFYKRKYPNETLDEQEKRLKKFIGTVDYENRLTETQLEYWIEKCDGDVLKAKELYKERQRTFSLDKCIKKYGKTKGTKVFNERQDKWHKSLTKNGNKCGWSKISQELFREIGNSESRYGEQGGELSLKDENGKIFFYDFVYDNKIIEYNGDQYHANPKKYGPDEMSHPYRKTKGYSAKDIWKKDAYKTLIAENQGYEVLVIWDSDYRKNKNKTILQCMKFLNEK